ncbi:hypothetical protein [Solimonas flava]|nr:hypothetical protein [Solimonas flava]
MDLSRRSDADILAVADPIMDNLMQASTAIDYERHVRSRGTMPAFSHFS